MAAASSVQTVLFCIAVNRKAVFSFCVACFVLAHSISLQESACFFGVCFCLSHYEVTVHTCNYNNHSYLHGAGQQTSKIVVAFLRH